MSPATGFLVLSEVPKANTLWMIATGTGVGLFISILKGQQVWQQYQQVVLVYAARLNRDIAYQGLVQSLLKEKASQFSFVPVISREKGMPGALQGRIPGLIENNIIQQHLGKNFSAEGSQVMLCGNPHMIADLMSVLEGFGLKKHLRRNPGHISLERYW